MPTSGLDERIDLAVEWLRSSIAVKGRYAGWGWVADIPPNPQNTAEVVCAFSELGVTIDERDKVCLLVRRDAVENGPDESWAFDSVLDTAWRISALIALDIPATDPDICSGVDTLLKTQDPEFGGWRLTGITGPISVTATAAAVQSLVSASESRPDAIQAAERGTRCLIDLVLTDDPRVKPLYAVSFATSLLSRPEIVALGGRRIERAKELSVERILEHLSAHEIRVEEERFQRGTVRDNWRHLSLHLSIAALGASGDSKVVFNPTFRRSLVELLDLQEVDDQIVDRGGFRTSREGFITSYSTTQALAAMASVRNAVNHKVNPALIYDVVCLAGGEHHSDPQQVVSVGHRHALMNSAAGYFSLATCGLGGLTIVLLAVGFHVDLGPYLSRSLVVWGAVLIALGVYQCAATRFIRFSKRYVAGLTFAGFTAAVLPVLSYLLA